MGAADDFLRDRPGDAFRDRPGDAFRDRSGDAFRDRSGDAFRDRPGEDARSGDAPRDRAALAGLRSPVLGEDSADEESMRELAALVETAGGEVDGVFLQDRPAPDPHTFLGKGKTEELRAWCEAEGATIAIFDNDLSPSQMRALTEALGVQVLDRTGLILDIFAQRAETREGRLQVELAQYQYLLPRLTGMWTHLERQAGTSGRGPIGSKGPGETQLETDRRHIRRKIAKLREELEEVRRIRGTQRRGRLRRSVPTLALVGYTNAGKSTLLNALTGAGIPANDRLFDTLDTTSRRLRAGDGLDVVVSDTVGFIRKLPHQLVEAFRATLEELTYADLLLHVIDVSDPRWRAQVRTVEALIRDLGAGGIPRIDVYDKCDALPPGELPPRRDGSCAVSARTGEGIDGLLAEIVRRLDRGRRVRLRIPYGDGGVLDLLYREAKVERVEYGEAIEAEAVCPPALLGRLGPYLTDG